MARIVVVTHEHDRFVKPWYVDIGGSRSSYLLYDLLLVMEERGHDVEVVRGVDETVGGDLAVAHVDCTRTPERYLDFVRAFPRSVNAYVGDVSKRRVSEAVLEPGDDWDGPVIVKSDLNYGGRPEARHNRAARRRLQPPPHPDAEVLEEYERLDSVDEVPDRVWGDPSRVVERFVPERGPEGYAMRTYVFMGEVERCRRHLSRGPVVKAENIVRSDEAAAPDGIRETRERLSFDFGKFDFVVHGGETVLLDANKTPGTTTRLRELVRTGESDLPDGLERMLP